MTWLGCKEMVIIECLLSVISITIVCLITVHHIGVVQVIVLLVTILHVYSMYLKYQILCRQLKMSSVFYPVSRKHTTMSDFVFPAE